MISFEIDKAKFNYRVGGVAAHGDQVLLQYTELDPFWVLPGGRVEIMESAADAAKREMAEELGIEVAVERLLWTVENFFTYDGQPFHEIGLYFLVNLPEVSAFSNLEGILETSDEHGLKHYTGWRSLDGLDDLDVRPSFLRTALKSLPDQPMHIVHTG
ncbi:MAG: NUDIX hydrolase [SAR202 cluster bacterium]|jgi:8-oxo-dGTP pyrophosphatase MutT (NUDIX family)|nr:DNA mismatch repair protein MutT [Chloroflexota bacterium]MDP6420385.1 NUDIX hydrolase [SAR202 cluster bacterium]HAL46342.1 DNA mismatch repair protein MutT [Dehalococcoidia bacterium]MDP6663433.1 NUDIX hydrolase [SAR202 cluster bacterium]MDP6800088.1 NUDIX hydrolase [SAR202 cluster bacterium]|tara:strand:+ start:571 stop:1044 length:474 start_codon:yes stop_codon:yes gene_type:complete